MNHHAVALILGSLALLPQVGAGQAVVTPALFRATKVAAYRDSFAYVVNGRRVGVHWFQMAPSPKGFVYQEGFTLSPMSRTLEVRLDSNLNARTSRAEGQI